MSEVPELRKNQFGVTCKTYLSGSPKLKDETLYFTVNKDSLSIELYPEKPVIILDKDAAKMALTKIAEIDRPSGLIPAQNSADNDKFPFQALPGKEKEGSLSADPKITEPVLNVGLRQLIEAEANKGHGYDEFKNAVLNLIGEHEERLQAKASQPVEAKAEPLGAEGIEQTAWQDFRDTGLPLLVNQMLHAFGWALTFFDDKGEGFDCIPKRVPYRGFNDQDMDEGYAKIAQYLKDNSDKILEEAQ